MACIHEWMLIFRENWKEKKKRLLGRFQVSIPTTSAFNSTNLAWTSWRYWSCFQHAHNSSLLMKEPITSILCLLPNCNIFYPCPLGGLSRLKRNQVSVKLIWSFSHSITVHEMLPLSGDNAVWCFQITTWPCIVYNQWIYRTLCKKIPSNSIEKSEFYVNVAALFDCHTIKPPSRWKFGPIKTARTPFSDRYEHLFNVYVLALWKYAWLHVFAWGMLGYSIWRLDIWKICDLNLDTGICAPADIFLLDLWIVTFMMIIRLLYRQPMCQMCFS